MASITITLDKDSYAPGETMTATAAYVVPPESAVRLQGMLGFLGGSVASEPTDVPIKKVELEDDDRAWTLVSDDGATAVFTSTA